MKQIFISIVFGYLCGCFQTSIFVGRFFKKIDIREHGSHNAGASNTFIVLGLPYGILTALLDILKSVIAVLVIRLLYPNDLLLPVLAGVATIIGHIFPIFFKLNGGKGVASLAGMILALDLKVGLVIWAITIFSILITDLIVVGSTVLYALFILMMLFGNYPTIAVWLAIILFGIAVIKHQSNYQRIIDRQELKVRASLSGKEKSHRL